ncbi:MAG: beta-propeller fold lactonase family protein [Planctomycetota bacterium]|jgi:6-phosphogluconolactonase (cycloisomerase 2 family)
MQFHNWLGKYRDLASRINWVRRARKFVNRRVRQRAPGYVASGASVSNFGPSQWMSSPRMRRALQRQDFYAAAITQTERLEDRTLLTNISISATDAMAAENAVANDGSFTVTIDGGTASGDVTINYTVSGTATATTDYTALSGTVTILDTQSSATIDVTGIVDDLFVEGAETVIVTLTTATGNVNLGSGPVAADPAGNATVTIADNDTAMVTLSGTANVTEGGATDTLTATLTLNTSGTGTEALKTAMAANDDFTASTGSFAVDAVDNDTVTITVTAVDELFVEGPENGLTASLATATGNASVTEAGSGTVNVADNDTATVADNDTATVGFQVVSSSVGEGTATHEVTAVLTISSNGSGDEELAKSVTVDISDEGTGATATGGGTDYTAATTTVTFAVGSMTAATQTTSGLLAIVNDQRVEGSELVDLAISINTDNTGGAITIDGTANDHDVTITDNDTVAFAFTNATSSVDEDDTTHDVEVTATLTTSGTVGNAGLDRTISIDVVDLGSGTADNGTDTNDDFTYSTDTLTFGSADGDFTSFTKNAVLTIREDIVDDDAETIDLELQNLVDGSTTQASITTAGSAHQHEVTINDDDTANAVFEAVAGAGDVEVKIDGGNLQILVNGVVQSSTPVAGVTSLTLTGPGDGSTVTLNVASGSLPATINFDGQGMDTLVIAGSNSTTVVAYDGTGDFQDGVVTIDGVTVNFDNVPDNTLNISGTDNLQLDFAGGDTNIVFTQVDADTTQVSGNSFTTTTFNNPDDSFQVNFTDANAYTLAFTSLASGFDPTNGIDLNGGGGNDTVTVTNLGGLTGALDIDLAGGASDALTFGTNTQSLASITALAETINVNVASLTTTGNQNYTGDISIGTNVELDGANVNVTGGISGNFNLTLDGTTGVSGTIGSDINDLTAQTGSLTAGTIDIDGNLDADTAVSTDTGAITVDGNIDTESTLGSATGITVLGTSELGGGVTAGNGNIIFGDAAGDTVTLTADVMIDSSANDGDVDVFGNVLGDFLLNVAASGGTVDFLSTVGATTPLSGLTVTSAGTLNFDNTVAVDDEGIDITAGAVTIDNTVTTTNNGTVEITNSGQLTIAALGDINADGAVTQNGSGAVSTAGDVTTTNDAISFATAVTLTGSLALNSGAGAGTITFSSTLNGTTGFAEDLTITAGDGNVDFDGAVGATMDLGDILINSAANVMSDAAVNADSFTQSAGTGTTTFSDVVNINSSGATDLAITTSGVRFDDAVTVSNSGGATITNAGLLDVNSNGDFDLDGAFLQNGAGTVDLSGDITTTADSITFTTAVTLTANVALDTGATGGDVTFISTLDEDGGTSNRTLSVTGGTGIVDFQAAVGSGQALAGLTINSAGTADFDSTVAIDASNLAVTAGIVNFDNAVTTTGGGTVTITNSGLLTIAADSDFNLDGLFLQNGAGAVSTAGDIDTTNDNVTFGTAVTLAGNVDIDTNTGAGTILFSSTIATGGNDLSLDAGATGNVTLSGSLTGGGDLVVRDGATQSYQVVTVGSVDIQSSLTSVTFNDTVTVSANSASGTNALKTNASGAITVDGAIIATANAGLNVDLDPTDVNVNAAITATGDIDITASNDVTIAAVALRADSDTTGGGTLTITADDDTTDAGDISAADGSTLRGHTVMLSGENITVDVVTSDTGDATFTADNEVTLNDTVTATTAQVVVTASDDDANINATISAGTNVDIDATAGSVLQTAGNILAGGSVSLDAGTAIDLNSTIGATTAIGTNVSIATNLNTPTLSLDGNITADGAVTIGGANLTGSVTIGAAAATVITADNDSSGTEDLTIRADGAISQQTAGSNLVNNTGGVSVTSDGSTVSLLSAETDGADQLTSVATNNTGSAAIIIQGSSTVTVAGLDSTGSNGTIEIVSDAASIVLSDVNAGTGEVFIEAALAVTDNNGGTNNITATSAAITATTGIASGDQLETALSNLAFSNTTSGDVIVTNTGGLTVNDVDGQNTSSNLGGAVTLTASSPVTFAVNTTANGNLTANATENAAMANDDITVNASVKVESTGGDITFNAGDDIILTDATSIVRANTVAGSDITLNSGFGDLDDTGSQTLNGTIQANTTDGIVTINTNEESGASDSTAGTITSFELLLLSSMNTAGSFTLDNDGHDVDQLAANVSGAINFRDDDGLAVDSVNTTNGIATGNGVASGAAVTIDSSMGGGGLIDVNQSISTSAGTGGGISITGNVTVDATITAAGDDVTLKGSTDAASDLDINANLVSDFDLSLSAPRDIFVGALVQTVATSGSTITLTADSEGNGVGGVRIELAGQVDGDSDVEITGSDLAASAGTSDAVEIESDGANIQVLSDGNITIGDGANAPGTSTTIINGAVQAATTGGTIDISAEDDVTFGVNGDVTGVDGLVTVTADSNGDEDGNGGAITMAEGATIDAGDGNISLDADQNVTLGALVTTTEVRILSNNGAIVDAAATDTEINITAATAALRAETGIGTDTEDIDTQADATTMTLTIAAVTESGDIVLTNSGALIVDTVDTLDGVTITDAMAPLDSTNDNITLIASSPLTVTEEVVNNDGGNITLTATNDGMDDDDLTISANVTALGGNGAIDLNAGTDLFIDSGVTVSTVGMGAITGDADRSIEITASSIVQTVNGSITLTANSGGATTGDFNAIDIDASTVQSSDGAILLRGTGGDTMFDDGVQLTGGTTVQTTGAGTITIEGTGVSGGADGVRIDGTTTSVTSGAGNIQITGTTPEDDGVDINEASVSSTGVAMVTISGTTTGNNGTDSDGVIIRGSTGQVASSGGAISISGSTAGGGTGGDGVEIEVGIAPAAAIVATNAATITVTGTGDGTDDGVQIDSAISSATGTVTIRSENGDSTTDDITFGAGGDVTSTSGTITIDAENAGNTADVFMHDDALINAGSGLIDIDADVDVTLGGLQTTMEVQINAVLGAIIDGGNTHTDITAATAELLAQTGIGDAGDTNGALETQADATAMSLTVAAETEEGDINITNSGHLIVGMVNATTGVTITDAAADEGGSDILLRAASPLTVNSPVANHAAGDITLAAEGTAVTDDMTINANVTATGGTGEINLLAGDSISLSGTTDPTVSAESTGQIVLAAGTNFAGATTFPGDLMDGNAAGDITMGDGSSVTSQDGTIALLAPDDITLSIVNADSNNDAADGTVVVIADWAGIDGSFADATGSISDGLTDGAAGEGATNITGGSLILSAEGEGTTGIGDAATAIQDIDTAVANLTAATDLGDIVIDNTGNLVIGGGSATSVSVTLTGSFNTTMFSQSGITVSDSATDDSGADSILVMTTGSLLVDGSNDVVNNDDGDITLAAEGSAVGRDLTIQSVVSVTDGTAGADANGNIYLIAGDDLTLDDAVTADFAVSTNEDGQVVLAAGTDFNDFPTNGALANGNADGDITMDDGTEVRTDDGVIALLATGSVAVSIVDADENADASAGSSVLIVADYAGVTGGIADDDGSITDNLTSNENANIRASEAILSAEGSAAMNGTGVGGDAAADDDLDTTLSNLAATTDSGDVAIDNTIGLTIGDGSDAAIAISLVGTFTAINDIEATPNADGDFDLSGVSITDTATNDSATDNITVTSTTGGLEVDGNNPVSNADGGNITLAAEGTAATDDLTIGSNVTASGGNGHINLLAGDTIDVDSGGAVDPTISATGTGQIVLAAGTNYNSATTFPTDLMNGLATGESDITMGDGSSITSEDGTIALLAPDDIMLSIVNANSNFDTTAGSVVIVADYAGIDGGIADDDGAISDVLNGENSNIIGGSLIISAEGEAGTGIGIDTEDIDTTVSNVAAVTDIGDINIDNTSALTIGDGAGANLDITLAGVFATTNFNLGGVTIQDSAGGDDGVDNITVTSASGGLTVDQNNPVLNDDGGDVTLAAEGVGQANGELNFVEAEFDGVAGVDGLNEARSIALSPDGQHVYITGRLDDALGVFSRNATTGELTFVEFERNGVGGVSGLNDAFDVVVSPDGNHVYVVGQQNPEVAVFSRDTVSGALTYLSSTSYNGGAEVPTAVGASGVVVSPDGDNVYITEGIGQAVVAFDRDASTGALTFLEAQINGMGGVTDLAPATDLVTTSDGQFIYVTSTDSDAVVVFSRNAGTGLLTFVESQVDGMAGVVNMDRPVRAALSPNEDHLYVTASNGDAVIQFSRNPATGQLTYVSSYVDNAGGFDGLDHPSEIRVSSDGARVYVAARDDNSVAAFQRNTTTGALSFLEIAVDGAGGVDGLDGASGLAISRDGSHVYVGSIFDDAIAAFEVTSNDVLTVNANVTASGGSGDISLYGGIDVIIDDTAGSTVDPIVSAVGTGDVLVQAGTDYNEGTPQNADAAGSIAMGDGSQITTEDGDVRLEAPGDISLSIVDADSNDDSTYGDVIVTADFDGVGGGLSDDDGAISDNLTGETATDLNIVADVLSLQAGSGIGSADDIDTDVATVAANNTGSNNIQIDDSAENARKLTIGTAFDGMADELEGITNLATGGTIVVTNHSAMDIDDSVLGEDDITITVDDSTTATNVENLFVEERNTDNDADVLIRSTSGNIEFNVGDDADFNGDVTVGNGGSTYQVITGSFTFAQAQADALARGGYVATIRSAAENALIAALPGALGKWIGASDSAVEGEWRWVEGPDAGVQFWQGAVGGFAVGGEYSNWNGGEPNNSGNEDAAQLTTGGRWNDLNAGAGLGYILETSGLPATITINIDPSGTDGDTAGVTTDGATLDIDTATSVFTTDSDSNATAGTFINGGDQNDIFNIHPQSTTDFQVNGNPPVLSDGAPNVPPGDILNLDLANVAHGDAILTIGSGGGAAGGAGAGNYDFGASGQQDIDFVSPGSRTEWRIQSTAA